MAPLAERAVELVELARHVREALALDVRACSLRLPGTELGILGKPCNFGAGKLELVAHAGRGGDRAPGRRCFEPYALEPGERRDEDARFREQRRSCSTVPRRSHVHAITQEPWDRRAAGQGFRAQQDELPVRQLLQRAKHPAQEGALVLPPLEDDQVALAPRLEELGLDPLADDAVVARKAGGGRLGSLLDGRDERVDAPEQAVALRPSGRI